MQFPLNSATGYVVGSAGAIIKTGTGGGGIEETEKSEVRRVRGEATIVRGVLWLQGDRTQNTGHRAELLDAAGRKVLDLKAGANDVQALVPGVYFVREAQVQAQAQAVRKVLVLH
jgi:hypothetical protein